MAACGCDQQTMQQTDDIEDLHSAAVAAGERTYVDQVSGYNVFTSETLAARGRCCGCACRHCPYNHENVAMEKRAARIQNPALLHGSFEQLSGEVDCLMWSGGKDSFLAARALRREHAGKGRLLLVTTFDSGSRTVAHQEVPITSIVRQAASLGLPLLGVPLDSRVPYEVRVAAALDLVAASGCRVARVCTGDLHLESIRSWRVANLGPAIAKIGATMHLPIWHVPYPVLLADLEASATPCSVCAIGDNGHGLGLQLGDLFSTALVARLGERADAFGENGEFHSLVSVQQRLLSLSLRFHGADCLLSLPFVR